ncbi:LysR family transcriptional regulator [Burkholderia sp. MSMB1552]|nr:LysR family transcriptional regulator [Burkholderia sp. MSMB1552]KWZ56478.1 LysR family transcriptional regulator [Burkholderia sp. MSMB1588]
MRDLNDLCYFVQVVDHGGFAPAGRALNMPKSKLSRRIALLIDIALRAAAAASVGVAQLPTMMVRGPIARGELRQLLPGWAPRREIVHAVFASRRGLLPSVRAARLSRPAFRRARAGLDNARAFDRYGARLRSAPAAARDHAARRGEFP